MEGCFIAIKEKLTRKGLKGFTISFGEAKQLGIIDEDLKCITQVDENKFRISVRDLEDGRKTKVVYDLLEAIKLKYQFKREVEEAKKILKKEAQSDSIIKRSTLVKDGIEIYMQDRHRKVQQNKLAITTYEQDIFDIKFNRLLNDFGVFDKKIGDVDRKYAQEFVDYMWSAVALTGANKGQLLKENTIYTPFSFIHKVFEYFRKKLRVIDYNPFSEVENKPKCKVNEKPYLIVEEIHLVKEKLNFRNIRFKTLATLIMDTGMRREEACALKYSDINRLRRTIKIQRAFVKSKLDGKYIIKDVKREKSNREITISYYALELTERLKIFKEACGIKISDDEYIFTAWDSNELISPDRFSREWTEFIKQMEVTYLPLKNLRDTHATYFMQDDKNIKAVQKRLGHSRAETTLNIYAQSSLYEDRKLMDGYENEFYNKIGVSLSDLYRIMVDRFDKKRKLIEVLETVTGEYIDDDNYGISLERFKEYISDLFPIFNKIAIVDSKLDEEEIDAIFEGFSSIYHSIKIEKIGQQINVKF